MTATRVVEFADVLDGRHLITVSAGPSLDPVLLSLGQEPDYRRSTAHGSFPKRRAASPNQLRVHFRGGEEWCSLDLPPTAENYHAVQPLREGRWLLVRGRAGRDDHNAHLFAADGTAGGTFHVGDAVADVQATERGRVWVSYFDEGVFGDDPLSRSGLACFDGDGTPVFRLADLPDPVLKTMADCYALNVCSDREAWLYFYTDFPLVRLLDGKARLEQQVEAVVVEVNEFAPQRAGQLPATQPVIVVPVLVDPPRVLEQGEQRDDLRVGTVRLGDPKASFQNSCPVDDPVNAVQRKHVAVEDHPRNCHEVVHPMSRS